MAKVSGNYNIDFQKVIFFEKYVILTAFSKLSILISGLVNRCCLNVDQNIENECKINFWSNLFFESSSYLQNLKTFSEVQTPPKKAFFGGLSV